MRASFGMVDEPSADGKTVWMAFSGEDHFSLRQAAFETADDTTVH